MSFKFCVYSSYESLLASSEKYVVRAEYDELKARLDHLQALVDRILGQLQTPAALGGVTTYAEVSPLQQHLHHQPLMPPPQNHPGLHVPTGQMAAAQIPPVHRYNRGEDIGATRPLGEPGSSTMVPMVADASPMGSARPTVNESPTSTVAIPQSSPLSLAAITSPFTPTDHAVQSKNCRAQTFMLGECLRPRPQILRDPATHTPSPRHQYVPKKPTYLTEIQHSLPTHLRRASVGSVISLIHMDLCIITQTESNEQHFSGCITCLYT